MTNRKRYVNPFSLLCDVCERRVNCDWIEDRCRYECDDCQRDNRSSIRTTHEPNGEWTAIDDNTYDGPGSAMGWGRTAQEATADLMAQFDELIEQLKQAAE